MTTKIAQVEHRNQPAMTWRQIFHKAAVVMNHWQDRHHTRQHLQDMPEYLLRDIGLDKQERQDEVNKYFWQR
ncbi:DUF1127 domain-containing protein [Celerinatantimonas diazotrophica]|uniref:Uncharacterized protein DUF1127 n=1 Tax=Celerinatantimonas diazotrophica TaxID=412034 RepID=A0A4R1K1G3_9GAMM|nr:DUF1127 domain-containing protein [Celerinatantimonas diazotrophica]TCK57730.1 uncharacterized protein DUF1127 [Celerinatantimonas diazotrophica]CAG9298208.1 hypothetical protein CEDIAZO_03403 [Celerinatantimonas diazotrophica]